VNSRKYDVVPAIVVVSPAGALESLDLATTSLPIPKGARKLDRVRVVVLNGRVMIAEDSPEGPKLIFQELITEISVEGKLIRVLTESGKTVAFTKQEHCNCGSRLRTWNPYGTSMYSSQDPS
jgi:hypothetical protein